MNETVYWLMFGLDLSKLENVAITNALQLEAPDAAPVPSCFNCDTHAKV